MLVWIFLLLAILAVTAAVVYGTLALRAPKKSADRTRYTRTAVAAAALTLVTVVAGGVLTRRPRDVRDFYANDLIGAGVGDDTFIETLAATT